MASPLGLFKESPRWRLAVIVNMVLTVSLILVQPEPDRPVRQRVTTQPTTQSVPPATRNVTSNKATSTSSTSSRVTSKKNVPVVNKNTVIRPGSSTSATKRDMNPPKVKTIAPSGSGSMEESAKPEVIPQDEEKNLLQPSG